MPVVQNDNFCFNCKHKHKIFKSLTEEELALVSKNRLQVTYNEGEIIFKQGAPITHIASITKGLVKIYIEGLSKRNLILQYAKPGDFFGGPGAFIDNIHHFSAIAAQETTACLINIDVFRNLIRKNNEFAYCYIEDISEKGIYNFEKFISLTQKQMHGRVAEALLNLKDNVYPENPDGFPLNRKDIAEMTALSKDSAGRILNSLEDSHIIAIKDNMIKILNRKNLEKISLNG